MADIVTLVRQVLGLDRRVTNPDAAWVEAKLDEQAAIIRALDAQIDAQRKSGEIRKRRKEDQAFR